MEHIVHRFYLDAPGFAGYAGQSAWQDWGVDGDPEGDFDRSFLRLRVRPKDILEVSLSRGAATSGWRRFMRRIFQRPLFRAVGVSEKRMLDLPAGRYEADLATFNQGDCRLTLQALDGQRMHVVLALGAKGRLRFAGAIRR